jgi:hypothetical protein
MGAAGGIRTQRRCMMIGYLVARIGDTGTNNGKPLTPA